MIGTKYYYLYRLQHCGADNQCNHKKLLNEKINAQEKTINKRTTFPQVFCRKVVFYLKIIFILCSPGAVEILKIPFRFIAISSPSSSAYFGTDGTKISVFAFVSSS